MIIIRDKTHADQVERWAMFVLNNPDKWKIHQTRLLNAQIEKAQSFIRALAQTEDGKARIIEAYRIENKNAYEKLFRS
jgi:hypothetical protein